MKLVMRHRDGEMGPKSLDEWLVPNGDEPLLIWMLREIERRGGGVAIQSVEDVPEMPGYYAEMPPS